MVLPTFPSPHTLPNATRQPKGTAGSGQVKSIRQILVSYTLVTVP